MRAYLFILFLLLSGISSAHAEINAIEQNADEITHIYWFNEARSEAIAYGRFPLFKSLRNFIVTTMDKQPNSVLSIANDSDKLLLILDDKRQFIEVFFTDDSIVVGNMSYLADPATIRKFKETNIKRQKNTKPVGAYLMSLVSDNYTQVSSL